METKPIKEVFGKFPEIKYVQYDESFPKKLVVRLSFDNKTEWIENNLFKTRYLIIHFDFKERFVYIEVTSKGLLFVDKTFRKGKFKDVEKLESILQRYIDTINSED